MEQNISAAMAQQRAFKATRPITEAEVEHYETHGFVHLKGILDADWIETAEAAFNDVMSADPETVHHADLGEMANMVSSMGAKTLEDAPDRSSSAEAKPTGKFWVRSFNWSRIESLANIGTRGPLPEIAASLMGASRINFYGDQLFLKEPMSIRRTAFHQDATYFHLEGNQCCTMWIPLDKVDTENSTMGYVRGSHKGPLYLPNTFVSQMPMPGASGHAQLPDIEGNEIDYDIVYCEAEPGDVIIHHVRTLHGSTGNTSPIRRRRAVGLRYIGEDVRYLERDGAPADSQRSPNLKDGDVMDSPEFPLIWTEKDGYIA
ncbi:MAG: phytanoyl-CoA dioxygenase family protein [Pseudomonadota bacterium]